jgi:hypothetical protein
MGRSRVSENIVTVTSQIRRAGLLLLAVAATTALLAGSASAQMERPDPAYRGLFGGDGGPPSGHALDLSASVYVGWDDNATARDGGRSDAIDPRFQRSSSYQGASLGLSYRRNWSRVGFGAGASTNVRYYPELDQLTSVSHGASAGLSVRLTRYTTWSASQSVAYVPYYQFGFFPGLFLPEVGDPIEVDPSLSLYRQEAWTTQSRTEISHRLSRRSSLSAEYSFYRTDYRDLLLADQWRHRVGGRWSYDLGAGLSARVGYYYVRAEYRGAEDLDARPFETHLIDAGVDYSGALGFGLSRRTTLSFSTGTAMYSRYDPESGDTDGLNVNVVVSANLRHQISRTWDALASYQRGLRFVDGFRQPSFQDSVSGQVGGYIGLRTSLRFFTGWANGGFPPTVAGAPVQTNRGYSTIIAGSTVQYALTRNLALYGQYTHYRYDFDERFPLPQGISPKLNRNSVQGGLSFWLPLLR